MSLHHASSVAVAADQIVKTYGHGDTQVKALDNISVRFATGCFTGIMGPSGSGKSTLLHCIAGLDRCTSGSIHLGGVSLADLNETELTILRRTQVGFVFQSFNLVPTLTALENIVLPTSLGRTEPDLEWVHHIARVVGLDNRLHHRPAELSGGQQQRVAVARAMASKPAVIFADEPTGNLDSAAGEAILQLMTSAVRDLGQTIVMVTHDPIAAAHAERVVFLGDGKIVNDLHQPTAESILETLHSATAGADSPVENASRW